MASAREQEWARYCMWKMNIEIYKMARYLCCLRWVYLHQLVRHSHTYLIPFRVYNRV